MKLDQIQKTMLAIVSVFENGRTKVYGQSYWNSSTNELSGGLLMASTLSGNMGKLLQKYQDAGGNMIQPHYVGILQQRNPKLLGDSEIADFKTQFKAAGDDPVMQQVQQDFFSDEFLATAENKANGLGITEPLGRLVILDSVVQGGLATVI